MERNICHVGRQYLKAVRLTALSLRRLPRLSHGWIVKEAVLRSRHCHCLASLAITLYFLARVIGFGYFNFRLHNLSSCLWITYKNKELGELSTPDRKYI